MDTRFIFMVDAPIMLGLLGAFSSFMCTSLRPNLILPLELCTAVLLRWTAPG